MNAAFCGYQPRVDLVIRFLGIASLSMLLMFEVACAHSPRQHRAEKGPLVPGALNDTAAVLQAVVALNGGPDSLAAARTRARYQDLDLEFCRAFDQDCSQPKPATTWYAAPSAMVRKLAALHGVSLIESPNPPLPACPIRPKRSEPNALAGRPVGYQVKAGLRFESPELAFVATETRCNAPRWWERDVLLNGNGYRVEYREGSWRAEWRSHIS